MGPPPPLKTRGGIAINLLIFRMILGGIIDAMIETFHCLEGHIYLRHPNPWGMEISHFHTS